AESGLRMLRQARHAPYLLAADPTAVEATDDDAPAFPAAKAVVRRRVLAAGVGQLLRALFRNVEEVGDFLPLQTVATQPGGFTLPCLVRFRAALHESTSTTIGRAGNSSSGDMPQAVHALSGTVEDVLTAGQIFAGRK